MPLRARPGMTDVIATADILDHHFVANSLDELDWECLPAPLRNMHLDKQQIDVLRDETRGELSLVLQAIS
jgi:hypothetical protein